jgi:Xaa-Pro aminopeptidase
MGGRVHSSGITASAVIDPDLVRQHVARAADCLNRRGADGLLVFRDTNILAFCGVPLAPSDRLVCGLLNRQGQTALVAPAFEADIAKGCPCLDFVATWEEHQDPHAAIAAAAAQLGLDTGRIVLDGHTWIEIWKRLAAALPRSTILADNGIIDSVRVRKTPQEVDAIRTACHDTGRIYPLIADRLRAGTSEVALGKEVAGHVGRDGCCLKCQLIQGGETASLPHQPSGDRDFREGDAVVVDCVCARGGYHGDMTRTFALGEPAADVRQAYAVVREAQRTAIEAVRPGVRCESVDRAARAVIEAAGLGPYFVHRLGHGIGLDGHEPPYIVQGNRQVLEPGMCVTVEPGVYLPGRFGIRIEDVVVVTEKGCEVLSNSVPTDVSAAFA